MVDRDELRKLAMLVEEGDWPRPVCPSCLRGRVSIQPPDPAACQWDARSERQRHHEDWGPDWITGVFNTKGSCDNVNCGETFAVAGDFRVDYGSVPGEQFSFFYQTRLVWPALPIMTVPDQTPGDVQAGVARAGALLLLDPPAAGNALRAALERYLTSEGIPSSEPKKNKPTEHRFLGAHERIEMWRRQTGNNEVADLFLAVKWLGNDGSHESPSLTADEVLTAAKILERAFDLLFTGPAILATAAKINQAKGVPPQLST